MTECFGGMLGTVLGNCLPLMVFQVVFEDVQTKPAIGSFISDALDSVLIRTKC